jgi:1-acyl-sn-glycerol-3-phosphate acyltransferase
MNAWGVIASSLYWGLRAATCSSVKMIDEGGASSLREKSPIIIVANHQSHADTAVLFAVLPKVCRARVRFVASASRFRRAEPGASLREVLERWLLHGLAVHAYRAILVGGDESGLRAIDTLSRLLNDGAAIAMYPEGTRSRDGTLSKLRPGVAMLALSTGCQVIPVRIDGTGDALPKSTRFPKFFNRVTVRVRGPLRAFPHETHAEFLDRVAASLEQRTRSAMTQPRNSEACA